MTKIIFSYFWLDMALALFGRRIVILKPEFLQQETTKALQGNRKSPDETRPSNEVIRIDVRGKCDFARSASNVTSIYQQVARLIQLYKFSGKI